MVHVQKKQGATVLFCESIFVLMHFWSLPAIQGRSNARYIHWKSSLSLTNDRTLLHVVSVEVNINFIERCFFVIGLIKFGAHLWNEKPNLSKRFSAWVNSPTDFKSWTGSERLNPLHSWKRVIHTMLLDSFCPKTVFRC